MFIRANPGANEKHRRARGAENVSRDCSKKQKHAIKNWRGLSANLHVNPARNDEGRANQRHETNVIAGFAQDTFGLPNPEEIVRGGGGGEKERNEMIIRLPMVL